ncbi:MAG TPA: hypothetical protein PKD34_01795 [Candidatus Doudnabacteria bacterium]|nr:hypothetical protein [Candidatus Doudnabacteria bacterium]
MNRNSIIARTLLFFAVYTGVVVILMYVVGIPTTRRMNFVLLSAGVGTMLALLIAGMFPRFAWLCRAVWMAWAVLALIGAIALAVIVVCFIGKLTLPLLSAQWYGISLLLATIGGAMAKDLSRCYWESYDSQAIAPEPAEATA